MNERRIATVQRVRSLQEKIARGQVAQCRLALDERRHEEAHAWETVQVHGGRVPSGPHQFVAHRAMLDAGVIDAAAAGQRVLTAAALVSTAMDVWRDEARRLDGIDRLAERIRIEAQAERQRLEANELDDMVVMRRRSTPDGTAP
jgi:hypothetical protein